MWLHKEKSRFTTANMKKRENTGKIIGKVFGEARELGVTALAAAVMLSGCGNAGNQAQKGGSGAEQTENTQTSVIIAMPPTSDAAAFRGGGRLCSGTWLGRGRAYA